MSDSYELESVKKIVLRGLEVDSGAAKLTSLYSIYKRDQRLICTCRRPCYLFSVWDPCARKRKRISRFWIRFWLWDALFPLVCYYSWLKSKEVEGWLHNGPFVINSLPHMCKHAGDVVRKHFFGFGHWCSVPHICFGTRRRHSSSVFFFPPFFWNDGTRQHERDGQAQPLESITLEERLISDPASTTHGENGGGGNPFLEAVHVICRILWDRLQGSHCAHMGYC